MMSVYISNQFSATFSWKTLLHQRSGMNDDLLTRAASQQTQWVGFHCIVCNLQVYLNEYAFVYYCVSCVWHWRLTEYCCWRVGVPSVGSHWMGL